MKRFSILFLLIPMMVLFSSCKQSQIKKLEKFSEEDLKDALVMLTEKELERLKSNL